MTGAGQSGGRPGESPAFALDERVADRYALDGREEQMFPRLTPPKSIGCAASANCRPFKAGDMLVRAGEEGHGLTILLSGQVEILQHDQTGRRIHIVTHEAGSFMGELAQLSGRPSLVNGEALTDGEAIAIAPDRLRAVLIAEAELGERIMRALILRRVGLIERGAGPIVVGSEADGDVLRLVNFLRRNGHPFLRLDPEQDSCGQALVDRFHVDERALPIVLCPGGQLLRNPTEDQLARCIGLVGPIDPDKLFDVAIVGTGPAGLATAVYAASEGLVRPCARLPVLRRAGGCIRADRKLPRLSDRHFGHGADGPGL